jgi:hypothetical protein
MEAAGTLLKKKNSAVTLLLTRRYIQIINAASSKYLIF